MARSLRWWGTWCEVMRQMVVVKGGVARRVGARWLLCRCDGVVVLQV